MKAKRISAVGISLVFSLLATWANAEPRLNGLAINSEFGKERFIAALYTNNRSTQVENLFDNNVHRRMELKVTADSISARSINSMWIEGMAINNPSATLEAEADNLAALNNMVRRRLREGDVMTFDAVPGEPLTISLNGVELGRINSSNFFNMLLRTWIGNIPLSTEFKDSLMAGGTIDEDLAQRYASIRPDAARIAAVEGWVEPPAIDAASAALAPPRPDIQIERPTPPPPAVATAPAPAQAEPEPATPAAAPSPAPAPAVAAAPPRPAPAPAPAPAPTPVEDDDEDVEEVMVTAETLLVRQHYVSDVLRQTLQNMRYPRRALERNQQGSIRLAVTVNRSGALQEVQIIEESPHSLLNREAVASVERASPFPAVPAAIAGDSLSFGIPVTFQLQ